VAPKLLFHKLSVCGPRKNKAYVERWEGVCVLAYSYCNSYCARNFWWYYVYYVYDILSSLFTS